MSKGVSRRFRRRSSHEDVLPSPGEDIAGDQALPDEAHAMEISFGEEPLLAPESRQPTRIQVRVRTLLIILLIVAGLVFVVFRVTDQIPPDLVARWPWLLVIGGALWTLVGLVTGWPHGTLGGPLVVALGVAALVEQQMPSVTMAVAGALLIALGLAVILRGLTMPRV